MTTPPPDAPTTTTDERIDISRFAGWGSLGRLWEKGVEGALFVSAATAILVTVGIVYVLFTNSLHFFEHVTVWEFVSGTDWSPDIRGEYGVLPLVLGTAMVTVGSAILAVPLGIATAVYLSEFAHPRVRAILKPILELLAGIPSIAFGLFAIFVVSPILQAWFDAKVFNAANAIVVLAFMVLPIITSLTEDALQAVPQDLRAGALALGATKWEVTKQVVLPAALSGVFAAVLLGFSRAIGETMAVTLAAGSRPQWGLDIFGSIQTMTSYIAQRAQGDIVQHGAPYYSLFAVGLLLFLMTFTINVIAQKVLDRYREVY